MCNKIPPRKQFFLWFPLRNKRKKSRKISKKHDFRDLSSSFLTYHESIYVFLRIFRPFVMRFLKGIHVITRLQVLMPHSLWSFFLSADAETNLGWARRRLWRLKSNSISTTLRLALNSFANVLFKSLQPTPTLHSP